jgi:hypothetical protein
MSSMMFPQYDPLVHKRIFHSLILKCVVEYFWTICALTPFSPSPTSSNTTSILTTLHLESDGWFPFSLEDYKPNQTKPNQNLELSYDSFKMAFQCMSHLSTSDLFMMVFKHL